MNFKLISDWKVKIDWISWLWLIIFPMQRGMVGFKVWMSFFNVWGGCSISLHSFFLGPSSGTGSMCRQLWSQFSMVETPLRNFRKYREVGFYNINWQAGSIKSAAKLKLTKKRIQLCWGSWSARQRPRLCEYSALLLLRRSRSKARDVQRAPGWVLGRATAKMSFWTK